VDGDPVTRRLRDLESVTDAALAYLPLDGLLDQLLTRVAEILDVDTAAILLLENEGRQLVARAAKGIEEEVTRGVRIPVGRGFAGRIASELRPIRILDIEQAEILNPLLREKGARGLSHTQASLTIARKLARRCFHTLRELGPDALEPIT
jgi:phosphoserine phosphatase RsbU/P